jgi:hypothetical protein
MVVLYKMHGCLYSQLSKEQDSVVITDTDYVNFISRMSTGNCVVPGHVAKLMTGKQFLFLGYSFNDWNVRSVYEMMVERRDRDKPENDARDYAVTRDFTKFEQAYCKRKNIMIIKTELDSFSEGIDREARH